MSTIFYIPPYISGFNSTLYLTSRRLSLSGDEYQEFWRNVQFTVDKDVVRTDRSHPYYAGQDNPNIQKMRYCVSKSNMLLSNNCSRIWEKLINELKNALVCRNTTE